MRKILAVCILIAMLSICSFASATSSTNLATPTDLVIVDKT